MQGNPDQGGIFIPEQLLPEVENVHHKIFQAGGQQVVLAGDLEELAKDLREEAYALLALAYFADIYTPEDES